MYIKTTVCIGIINFVNLQNRQKCRKLQKYLIYLKIGAEINQKNSVKEQNQ